MLTPTTRRDWPKAAHDAKSQYIARDRPVTLGLMDPSRTTQTPIMPRFAQANVLRGRRYRPGRTGLAGYGALDHNQATLGPTAGMAKTPASDPSLYPRKPIKGGMTCANS